MNLRTYVVAEKTGRQIGWLAIALMERKEQVAAHCQWTEDELHAIYSSPLMDLVLRASRVHAQHHNPSEVQCCHLISIKTGGCTEDCHYCAQAARYHTHVKAEPMMPLEEVQKRARKAKTEMTRICLVAAWRQVKDGAAFQRILDMVKLVRAEGVEVCCSLGMLQEHHLEKLKEAGAYAINHNLDTSEAHYSKIITTRKLQDRLETIELVRKVGLTVCCGGIIGMGESIEDRIAMLRTLAGMQPHPESVPINLLVPIKGTPLEKQPRTTVWELLRMVATARIALPNAMLRLSAGRKSLSFSQQALCFIAGVNSIHTGEKLLTTPNQLPALDQDLFRILGLQKRSAFHKPPKKQAPPKQPLETWMQSRLKKRKKEGILRSLRTRQGLVDLTSNDYLGFARSNKLLCATQKAYDSCTAQNKLGATGSRLLTGNSGYMEELEQKIARFHRGASALLFNSGYVANLGLLSSIATEEDTILLDTQVHASTWDGAKLSKAHLLVFRHNDLDSLQTQLCKSRGRIFVCVESLYSLSGDIAPLKEISALCHRYGAHLVVDESHATGIFGLQGRGLVCALGLEEQVFARIHTFSKALGCHAAAIIGSQLLRKVLLNFSRPLIYTTAFPLHTQVAISCAYDLCEKADPERQQLQRLILSFCKRASASSLAICTSASPIQAVLVKNASLAQELSQICAEAGFDVRALVFPTVRKGQELLRICLHAFNSEEQIDLLFCSLEQKQLAVKLA